MKIDWEAIYDAFTVYDEDPEAAIHEIAHIVDCCGEVRECSGADVDALVLQTYGSAKNEYTAYTKKSDMAEIRASAITKCVLKELGLLTERVKEIIESSCSMNLRSQWGETLKNRDFIYQLINAAEHTAKVRKATQTIVQYCRSFPLEEE